MKMNKISREAEVVTELRSNFSRGCTEKGKMKCMRAGNLVSKAQPWVSEGVRSCNDTMGSRERGMQKPRGGEGGSRHPRYLTSSRRRHSPILWTNCLKKKRKQLWPCTMASSSQEKAWGQAGSLRQGTKPRKHITLFPGLRSHVAAAALCLSTLTHHRVLHLGNCLPVLDPCISLSGERK